MISDQARQRAEQIFRKEERARDGRAAMIEYEAHAINYSRKVCAFESAPIG
jgi:hypothetical protein